MKRSVTYREVTVAIGVLVAMVIALTLWIGYPQKEIAFHEGQGLMLPSLKEIFHNPQLLLSLIGVQ